MLYDRGVIPRPGSLLETVLTLVAQRRQYAQYLETRVLMEAMLAPHLKDSKLDKTWERYANSVLPYIEGTSERTDEEEQKILNWWTSQKGMRVKPLWMASKNVPGRLRSALRRGAEKVKETERMRRQGRLKAM